MVPREHGAYGQLLLPVLTAMALRRSSAAALAVATGAAAAFVAHEPLLVSTVAAALGSSCAAGRGAPVAGRVRIAAREERCGRTHSPFGTVENPIRMMGRENHEAADGLRIIRELTASYTAPEDGCTTYAVCTAELARFETDRHRLVHLETT